VSRSSVKKASRSLHSPRHGRSKERTKTLAGNSSSSSSSSSTCSVATDTDADILTEMNRLGALVEAWEFDIEARLPEEVYLDVISLQAYADNITRGYAHGNDQEHHNDILEEDACGPNKGTRQREAEVGIRLSRALIRWTQRRPDLLSQMTLIHAMHERHQQEEKKKNQDIR
jgi:hypothetical protein